MPRWIKFSSLKELFGADLRSLALLRVGTALLLLTDLFYRLPNLVAHYTDEGILPRSILTYFTPHPSFSLHAAGGSWQFEAVLFLIAGSAACALLLGYKTKAATIISWIFLV